MENINSVCYINRINNIEKIEGADNIELATVNGWKSIVSKGSHQIGDLVLCITTDAVIPENLAIKWGVDRYLRSGNRVRTVKLKGVYSECILITLNQIPLKLSESVSNLFEGRCLMDRLDVYKYEPPVKVIQDSKGRKHRYHQNPNFYIYYKFPNFKNTPNMFTEEDEVVITRKMHGTNARYGIVKKIKITLWDKFKNFFKRDPWFEYEFVYGSHNVEKGSDSQGFYSTDVWKDIADKYNIKNKLWKLVKNEFNQESIGSGFIIYGEIVGPGIQGKEYHYNLKEHDFFVFDVQIDGKYQNKSNEDFYIDFKLNLKQVPMLFMGKFRQKWIDRYIGGYIEGTKVPHEGLVVKCISGDRNKVAKFINPEYTIYSEKHLVPDSH